MNKKISLMILAVILLLVVVIPSNKAFAALARVVNTVNVTQENGKLTVSGDVEDGMLAVAVQVFDENEQFIKLETGAVSSDNKYEVVFTLSQATYIVKVADFDGGEVVTKRINGTTQNNEEEPTNNQEQETTNNEEKAGETTSNPKTGDNIVVIFSIFAVATIGTIVILKVNKNRETRKN